MAVPDRTSNESVICGRASDDARIEMPGLVFFGRQSVYAPTTIPAPTRMSRTHGSCLNAFIAVALIVVIVMFFTVAVSRQIHTKNNSTQEEVYAVYLFQYEGGKTAMLSDINATYNNFEVTDDTINNSDLYSFTELIELEVSCKRNLARLNFEKKHGVNIIHDFHYNQTAFIDYFGQRCFIMDLDYSIVMTPKSFFDNVQKKQFCNFSVNRFLYRMQIRLPSVTLKSMERISTDIADICVDYKTYTLEKLTVEKDLEHQVERSTNELSFEQFFGKGIVKFQMVNIGEFVLFN